MLKIVKTKKRSAKKQRIWLKVWSPLGIRFFSHRNYISNDFYIIWRWLNRFIIENDITEKYILKRFQAIPKIKNCNDSMISSFNVRWEYIKFNIVEFEFKIFSIL